MIYQNKARQWKVETLVSIIVYCVYYPSDVTHLFVKNPSTKWRHSLNHSDKHIEILSKFYPQSETNKLELRVLLDMISWYGWSLTTICDRHFTSVCFIQSDNKLTVSGRLIPIIDIQNSLRQPHEHKEFGCHCYIVWSVNQRHFNCRGARFQAISHRPICTHMLEILNV